MMATMMRKLFEGQTPDVFPGIITRNKTTLDYENYIHRTFYPLIIHPYSRFRVYYEVLHLITFPVRITAFMYLWIFKRHDDLPYQLYLMFCQALNIFDMTLMFFTGYVEKGTEIVVLKPRKIALKYLFTYFLFDLVSCIPYESIMKYFDPKALGPGACGIDYPPQAIMFATAVSFFLGSAKFFLYLKNTAKVFLWNPFSDNLIAITFVFNLLVLFNADFSYFLRFYLGYQQDLLYCPATLRERVETFFSVVLDMGSNILFLYEIRSAVLGLMEIPCVVVSYVFNITFTAFFIKFIDGKMRAKQSIFILESKFRSMTRKGHFPKSLKQKTLLYFKFLLKNKLQKEDAIFSYFPEDFKAEIMSFFCLPLIKTFYPFEDLPAYVQRRLAESLKYQLHLPNELVTTRNDPRISMYFVQQGTVALYSENNVELYHFEDGSSFYGRMLIEGGPPKPFYAVSIEVTEIYRLDQVDFLNVLSVHPTLLENLKEKIRSHKARAFDLND